MEKSSESVIQSNVVPQNADITHEPYKGPSPTIASLGYGFVDFKVATVASLIAGVVGAFFVPKQVNKALSMFSEETKILEKNPNILKKSAGFVMQRWDKAGEWFVDHFPFRNIITNGVSTKYISFKGLGDEGWKSGSKVAGMIMTPLFFITGFTGIARGVHSANMGRSQFERAKNEIKDLRAENTALRTKNAEILAQDVAEDNAQSIKETAQKTVAAPAKNLPVTAQPAPVEQGTEIGASDKGKAKVPSPVVATRDAALDGEALAASPNTQMAV